MRIIIFVASPGYVDPDRVMGTENVYLSGWSVYVTSDPRIVLCLHLVTGSKVLALTIKRCHRKSACHQGGGHEVWGGRSGYWADRRSYETLLICDRLWTH